MTFLDGDEINGSLPSLLLKPKTMNYGKLAFSAAATIREQAGL
jgi:hypothetical protein